MESLFTTLTEALYESHSLALLAAFLWGVLSILLSPCHLSTIPLVVGFLSAQHEKRTIRGTALAFAFAFGVLVTIALIGIITAALGRIMGDVGPYGKYVIAALFFVVGLYLMDIIRLPGSGIGIRPFGMRSVLLSALSLGLVFGLALGPCTFAFVAPVLGVVFQLADTSPLTAGSLVVSFGLGHCSVIVAAGGATSRVQAYLDWTGRSQAMTWIKRAAGLLVLLSGIYALYSF